VDKGILDATAPVAIRSSCARNSVTLLEAWYRGHLETCCDEGYDRSDALRGLPVSSQPAGTLGLECVIGGHRFALPAESVAQIVEYDVSPLPHAGRWVAGLGLLGTRVLVSVALTAQRGGARGRRSTKGVLLNAPSSPVGWALEVSEVSSFVHAQVGTAGAPPRLREGSLLSTAKRDVPSWLERARTSDGRTIGWIDALELVRALSVGGRDSPSAGPPSGADRDSSAGPPPGAGRGSPSAGRPPGADSPTAGPPPGADRDSPSAGLSPGAGQPE
jgi:hypothetical protein